MNEHYIMEEKFPMQIDENVFVLGNYYFNLYLVVGKKYSVLFEVGVSSIVKSIIKQLETLDIEPDYLIVTHPHSDHITGLPGLLTRYPKAKIIVAKGAQDFIEHPKAGPLMVYEDMFMSKSLAKLGIKISGTPLKTIPDMNHALVVKDRKLLECGDITLELIVVNGHSPGNLIGILKKERIMFCSDSMGFYFPGRRITPLFFTNADEYIETLNFIKNFNPLIICPAHQGHISNDAAKKAIQLALDTTIDTIKYIKESKLNSEELANELFDQMYRDEFKVCSKENMEICAKLLVRRSKEFKPKSNRFFKL